MWVGIPDRKNDSWRVSSSTRVASKRAGVGAGEMDAPSWVTRARPVVLYWRLRHLAGFSTNHIYDPLKVYNPAGIHPLRGSTLTSLRQRDCTFSSKYEKKPPTGGWAAKVFPGFDL